MALKSVPFGAIQYRVAVILPKSHCTVPETKLRTVGAVNQFGMSDWNLDSKNEVTIGIAFHFDYNLTN